MKLYRTADHVRLLPGGGPVITIPTEVMGLDTPSDFVANLAYMAPNENDPSFAAMTAFGIRYVGWMLANETAERPDEWMIYVDAPSGASVHMSAILKDHDRAEALMKEALNSLPWKLALSMIGKCKIEISPMRAGQVIAFV